MAGILDKKTRFVDLVVTQEGKRQIAAGKLRAEFASLTDSHAFYDSSGSYAEACDRIYFQVMERPENSLVIEKDDSGKLLTFDHSPTGSIVGNAIFEKENVKVADLHKLKIATGSQFASLSAAIEQSFIRHFDNNFFLSSVDLVGDEAFQLNTNSIEYEISPVVPFASGAKKEIINVNQAEPFLLDGKLTHLSNFDYLPPVNEDGSPYGEYTDIRNTTRNTWQDIIDELGYNAFARIDMNTGNDVDVQKNTQGDVRPKGLRRNRSNIAKKEFKTITFDKTSKDNNLLIQVFEKNKNMFKKLDIVDAGVFVDDNDPNNRYEKQVYYVGKIYLDDFNTPTFINLFTLIFD